MYSRARITTILSPNLGIVILVGDLLERGDQPFFGGKGIAHLRPMLVEGTAIS
jgi:hypothetical protein